ncbi:hypothetical protein [Aeromonas phage 59.1]|nr:hypothetical protein [Aeromonas phage 59.1]
MNIEMKVVKTIPFHMVEPSKCFIPLLPGGAPDDRNLWMKLSSGSHCAVNLFSGVLMELHADTVCRPVIAKVVVE